MPARLQAVLVMRPTGAPCSVAGMAGSKRSREVAVAMGRRIAEFREKRGLNQSDLAKALGIKVQSVQQWENGQTQPRPEKLPEIAAVLECSVHALTSDDAEHRFDEAVPLRGKAPKRIPLISSAPAGAPMDEFDQRIAELREPTVPTFFPVSSAAFALRVRGDSMEPLFPNGCIITVEPNFEPRSGLFVVVRFDGTSEHTFKQLIVDGPHRLLKPINPRYPVIALDENAVICGVVVEHHQFHVPGSMHSWL